MDNNLKKWANNLHKDSWQDIIDVMQRNELNFNNEADMKYLFKIYNDIILPRGYEKQHATCVSCRISVHKHFKMIAQYYADELGRRG